MENNLILENGSTSGKWNFNGALEYVDQWILMKTPYPLIIITISYLLFVVSVGPRLMKNRPPISMNNFLILYNIFQVAFSLYLCYIGTSLLWRNGLIGKSCLLEIPESRYTITTSIYTYFIAKVTELLDTILFVLRKKDNQVTFLHVYHHLTVMWCTWFNLKYEPSYNTIFLGTLNSYVHVIMYTYYGMSAVPELAKNLWWKKYITSLQLVQFVLILLHAVASAIYPGCPPTYTLILMINVNASLFIYLFGKFYINTYTNTKVLKNQKRETENDQDLLDAYLDKIK
ncbi:elongation of very long chain fatty acids protein 7-like [Melitaea cinxia]|uniref:elongation of very long chain fatty acids protein 7-like n=1 Tax=Melitaea cinxia TaxID=113334 RepID=UPI001E274CCE|nr:elongation of very long chain fatty acids protein 7-like [Melitaea cinxia]